MIDSQRVYAMQPDFVMKTIELLNWKAELEESLGYLRGCWHVARAMARTTPESDPWRISARTLERSVDHLTTVLASIDMHMEGLERAGVIIRF
jgi:hypothetical protein